MIFYSIKLVCFVFHFVNFYRILLATIENPEGKNPEGGWIITHSKAFDFCIEGLTVGNSKYEPFVANVQRGDALEKTNMDVQFRTIS